MRSGDASCDPPGSFPLLRGRTEAQRSCTEAEDIELPGTGRGILPRSAGFQSLLPLWTGQASVLLILPAAEL